MSETDWLEEIKQKVDESTYELAYVGLEKDVPRLIAEVERLRGLIASVQASSFERQFPSCPWCWHMMGAHKTDCPAFTPEGSLR